MCVYTVNGFYNSHLHISTIDIERELADFDMIILGFEVDCWIAK